MKNKNFFLIPFFLSTGLSFAMEDNFGKEKKEITSGKQNTQKKTAIKKNQITNQKKLFEDIFVNHDVPCDDFMKHHGWKKSESYLDSFRNRTVFTKERPISGYSDDVWSCTYYGDGSISLESKEFSIHLTLSSDHSSLKEYIKTDYSYRHYDKILYKELNAQTQFLHKKGLRIETKGVNKNDTYVYDPSIYECTIGKGEPLKLLPVLETSANKNVDIDEFFKIGVFYRPKAKMSSDDIPELLKKKDFVKELNECIPAHDPKACESVFFTLLNELPKDFRYHDNLAKIIDFIKDNKRLWLMGKEKPEYYDTIVSTGIIKYFETSQENEEALERLGRFQRSLDILSEHTVNLKGESVEKILNEWTDKLSEDREFLPIPSDDSPLDQWLEDEKKFSPKEIFQKGMVDSFLNGRNSASTFKQSMYLLKYMTNPKTDKKLS